MSDVRIEAQCGLARWQVKRVSAYMRENLDRKMTLSELAGVLGLSRYHFCRAFRAATGHTPIAWLTRLRVEEAQQILAVPSISILDVAQMVGYQTSSAFTARFRRVTGMSPSELRRRL